MSKQYGLILPGNQKIATVRAAPPAVVKPSIFDESSDASSDDNAAESKLPKMRAKSSTASGPSLMERRVARRMQEKALAEDPTVFQYDELYDDMENQREEAKQAKSQDPRKPKYIGKLMEYAERRKLQYELRVERQVQKDREAEGEEFKDKEIFVTSAYRQKLESLRKMQEEDAHKEYLETIGDVTKQKDLDGFYRHIYEQKLGSEGQLLQPKTAPSGDDVAYKPIKSEKPATSTTSTKQRSYRRRRSSEDEQMLEKQKLESPEEDAPKVLSTSAAKSHLANNIDADSDFSIDDSSDEEQEQSKTNAQKSTDQKSAQASTATKMDDSKVALKFEAMRKTNADSAKEKESLPKKTNHGSANDAAPSSSDDETSNASVVAAKPKIDRKLIWQKRTVGEAFDEALARYHERKRNRRA